MDILSVIGPWFLLKYSILVDTHWGGKKGTASLLTFTFRGPGMIDRALPL